MKETYFPFKNVFKNSYLEDYNISYLDNPVTIIFENTNLRLELKLLDITEDIIYFEPILKSQNKTINDSYIVKKSESILYDFSKLYKHYDNTRLLIIKKMNRISTNERDRRRNNWFPKMKIKK